MFSTREGSAPDDDSYMGYSTVVGHFLEGERYEGIAVGMPRGNRLRGKVRFCSSNVRVALKLDLFIVGAFVQLEPPKLQEHYCKQTNRFLFRIFHYSGWCERWWKTGYCCWCPFAYWTQREEYVRRGKGICVLSKWHHCKYIVNIVGTTWHSVYFYKIVCWTIQTFQDETYTRYDYIDGINTKGRFGHAVASLKDLNQDGYEGTISSLY